MSLDLNDLLQRDALPHDLATESQDFQTWSAKDPPQLTLPARPRIQLELEALDDLLQAASEPMDWLVEQLIPANQVTLLAGAPKAGKSTLMLGLVRSLVLGHSQFAGFRMKGAPIRAAYFYEDGRRTFSGRVARLGLTEGLLACGHRDAMRSGLSGAAAEEIVEVVTDLAADNSARLVVVDTLRRWFRVEENDQDQCELLIAAFQACAQAKGLTVVLLHHTKKLGNEARKPSLEDVRGASALVGAPDQIVIAYRRRQVPGITPIQLWVEGRDIESPFAASVEPDPGSPEWRRTLEASVIKEEAQLDALERAVVEAHAESGSPVSQTRAAKGARDIGVSIANDARKPLLDELIKRERLVLVEGRYAPVASGASL